MPRIGVSLILQARMLAGSDPRRPKQATLRRAISTAYYGIFHFLIEESTQLLLGTAATDAPFRELGARSFEHGKMKSLCKEFLKPNAQDVHVLLRPFWGRLNIAGNQQLILIAQAFI